MRNLILAILALALAPIAASAETPQNSWENLRQLQPGHNIKVFDKSLKSWSGKLLSVSDETITIQEKRKQQEITVERANVLRVIDLKRTHRKRNALIGLAVGAAIGSVFSADDDWDLSTTGKLIVTSWFSGAGSGVGALVPGPPPTLYRSKQPPQPGRDPQK